MVIPVFASQQKALLLGHELWIAQRGDGKWRIWIAGTRHLQDDMLLSNILEAKSAVHSLAHQHLEGKQACDCKTELVWEVPSGANRREAKRINYVCDISIEDQGVVSMGRISDLSVKGTFIQTPNPAVDGSTIGLNFQIGGLNIDVKGRVVHRRCLQGMGVLFLNLDKTGFNAIAQLVEQAGKRESAEGTAAKSNPASVPHDLPPSQ